MGIINPIEVNPVTLRELINATYAVLAENSRHLKHTAKLEKLDCLLCEIEEYYLKDLNDD
jgi:hypothetical protein